MEDVAAEVAVDGVELFVVAEEGVVSPVAEDARTRRRANRSLTVCGPLRA